MPANTNRVTISSLFRNRRGSITYRLILAIFGIALKIFFRRIETVNADSVPTGTGVIFVMNHANGLIDPALVFVALPRRSHFSQNRPFFECRCSAG
jgi:1-acyl-sn-glycerol-3-phosphate acyltransferase